MAALTTSYASIAADVTAVAYVQCVGGGSAELIVASSAPESTVVGVVLAPGETATADQLQAIKATGAVYARTWPKSGSANMADVQVVAAS